MWNVAFWKGAADRAVRTFAQSLGAILVADGTGLLDTAWTGSLSMAGMAALISLLTSVGGGALTSRTSSDARISRYESPNADKVIVRGGRGE